MTILRGEATLEVAFSTDREAEVAYEAILPEHQSSPGNRSRAKFKRQGKVIYVEVQGDAASFRASLSSYLRWLRLSLSLMED